MGEGVKCKEDERGITAGEGKMRETQGAEVVSNGVMKGGGRRSRGRDRVPVRQMY